ncbi:polysaccharide deacetylase family protein [Bacillus pinisoli]|uniref:polysaccharide deacetylase family protein n=1 Tax=Bacillus pinisoli TaxID=2901866 RepID=UPI001FF2739F|nr:polysaccharide deacetylase family protein [Bacillus pinisoli]
MKSLSVISLLLLSLMIASCSSLEDTSKAEEKEQDKINSTTEEGIVLKDDAHTLENSSDSNAEEEQQEVVDKPFEPTYRINQENWSIEPIADANKNVVLLTIDDAPDQYGLEMAKVLKEYNAPAIFFVNGHFIDSPEEENVLKQIHELGFQIGNHTWNHKNLKKLTEEEQQKEISSLNQAIERITGEPPVFFRAPFGANTDYVKQFVKQQNMVLMNWTYGYDFMKEYMNEASIADVMVNTNLLTNGANLLMHDREWTYQALPKIIEGIRQKGYEFVDPKLIELPLAEAQ